MWNRTKAKYGNKKTEHAGRSFDSKLESKGFDMLMLREAAGELKILRQRAHVDIVNVKIFGTKVHIYYIADFECEDDSGIFYVEIKGFEVDLWKMKKKLYRIFGERRLEIWKSRGKGLYLDETIKPLGAKIVIPSEVA